MIAMACLGLPLAGALSGCAQKTPQLDDALYAAATQDAAQPPEPNNRHAATDRNEPPIPLIESRPALPPAPFPVAHDRLVSVTVTEKVPLRDVLIELANEAKINVEIDPRIKGGVIFSAHNQPFDDVLRRLCALGDLRATVDGTFLRIAPDEPYQKTYPLDYLSLSRRVTSQTDIATNVFDVDVANGSGGSSGTSSGNGASAAGNNSTSKLSGSSETDFWAEVEQSLTRILDSTERAERKEKRASAPQASGKRQTPFSIDKQAGLITVFGDSRQHESVATYLRTLKRRAYAQVLIDARIVEVELNDSYKSGINWRTLMDGSFNAATRFGASAVGAPFVNASTATDGVFTASWNGHDFATILNLVRSFGKTRVLSAPRLTVLNNQTAVLKVATNQVYFVTQAQFTTVTNANGATVTTTPVYTSTPRTVPVGLVMTVQPAIDIDHGRITMTLRPTISRVVGQASDPSIGLNAAQAGVTSPIASNIPILAVREMDSVIRLRSGEVAIMGGLMQSSSQKKNDGIPMLDSIFGDVPLLGNLVKSSDDQTGTTELVILLRATMADPPTPDEADRDAYYESLESDPRPFDLSRVARENQAQAAMKPAAFATTLPPPPPLPTDAPIAIAFPPKSTP